MKNQKQAFDLLLVFLTVGLFYLAFPSGGYGFLAWVAIVPTLFSLYGAKPNYAFTLALLAATFGWFCSIWWVIPGIADITYSHANLIIPFVFLFCVVCALPYAIGAWFYVALKWNESVLGALKAACLFTVLVNYIPHILPGNIVHSLYLSPMQIQLADIGGVGLVFFIIHAVSFLLAGCFVERKRNKQKSLQYLVVALLFFMGNLLYGFVQSALIEQEVRRHHSNQLTIAMVQPNIDVKLRTRDDWLTVAKRLQTLIHQTLSVEYPDNLLSNKPDLIIFPEVPVPLSFEFFDYDKKLFSEAIGNTPLLLTAIEPINKTLNENNGYFNTIELIQHNQVTSRYQKQKLLPIGEYLPFEKQLPWLRKMLPYAPNYKSGEYSKTLPLLINNNTINIIPLICYEAVFTDLVGKSINTHNSLLINTVNDAWFANTAGVNVHLALSLFRTIEYRTPLVRATNTGISSIINAQGKIIAGSLIESNKQGVSITQVYIKDIETFYQKYPNTSKIIFILITLLSLIVDWKKVKLSHEHK